MGRDQKTFEDTFPHWNAVSHTPFGTVHEFMDSNITLRREGDEATLNWKALGTVSLSLAQEFHAALGEAILLGKSLIRQGD